MSTPEKDSQSASGAGTPEAPQHTPGPWRQYPAAIHERKSGEITFPTLDDGTPYIEFHAGPGYAGTRDPGFGFSAFMSEADARLIAAAPDLLNCMIHLTERDWFHDGDSGQVVCCLDADKVRAAIAKATNILPHPPVLLGGDQVPETANAQGSPVENIESRGDAGFIPFYQAGKTIGNGWGFKTPSGSVDGFETKEAAQRIADVQKEQDREEAKTGTGPIAAVLRKHFEAEPPTPRTDAAYDRADEIVSKFRREDLRKQAEIDELDKECRQLERELSEANEQLADWRGAGMKIGAMLVSAGSKRDGIVDGVADIIAQRDRLAEVVKSRYADMAYNDQQWNKLRAQRDALMEAFEIVEDCLRNGWPPDDRQIAMIHSAAAKGRDQ